MKSRRIFTRLLSDKSKYETSEYSCSSNPIGLFSLDVKGFFTSSNMELTVMAEIPEETMEGYHFKDFCAKADLGQVESYLEKTLRGEDQKFEASFISFKKNELSLEITLLPLIYQEKVIGVYGNVKRLSQLKQEKKTILKKRKYLDINTVFIGSLLKNELEQETMKKAFGIIGESLNADRMYYFWVHSQPNSGETLISQQIEWTNRNTSAQINNPEMVNLPASEVEPIMENLHKNIPFTGVFSKLPEGSFKDIFRDQEIKAMLLLPIFLKDRLYGFIGFDDCTRERTWTHDEITFAQGIANNLTISLERRTAETQIKEQEKKLLQNEQKFRALVQEGADFISILDLESRYLFSSGISSNFLGIPNSELLNKKATDFVHPDDVDRVRKDFEKLHKKRQVKIAPYRFKNKKGDWKWLQTIATNLTNDPAVNGIVVNSRDVTKLLEQAREIKNINERYQLSATATNDLIYDWDLEKDQVTRFHKGLEELYGYPASEIAKKEFWDNHIHPDDRQSDLQKLNKALENPKTNFIKTEYRFRQANGSYATVIDKGYIIRNKEGKAIRLVGATSDISELTAKEEALKVANKRFKLAMKATEEMIWDWNIESDVVTRSDVYKKLFGYDCKKEADNSFWRTKIHSKDKSRVLDSLKIALNDPTRFKWQEEYRFIKADGNKAHIIDRGYIIRNKEGIPTRMVGAVLDVSRSREMIRKIKKQNKLLKKISWEQSHLVRSPLARIKALLPLLEAKNSDEMKHEEILGHLNDSANELDAIIQAIVEKSENMEFPKKGG